MLVPAFAFAWWLVSLPTFPLHPLPTRDVLARAQTSSEMQVRAIARGESRPADEAVVEEPMEGEWGGERVMLKIVTPAIVRVAQGLLDLPMGDERFVGIDGHRYVFVLERHYHPPGFVGAPTGWHKGVTVYELR
jgi:hypothetical protein